MNCEELNTQIMELEKEFGGISEQVQEFSQVEGMEKKKLQALDIKVAELEKRRDEILEKYFEEFARKYPEMVIDYCSGGSYGELIEGFPSQVQTVTKLSDTQMLVVGRPASIRILEKNEDGNWVYGEELFKTDDFLERSGECFRCVEHISDDEIMMIGTEIGPGSDRSAIMRILKKQGDGQWRLCDDDVTHGKRHIAPFKNIYTSQSTPEGEIILMGVNGETGVHRLESLSDGREFLDLEYSVNGFCEAGETSRILTSERLSETDILVAGENGETKVLRRDKIDIKWSYWERISGFNSSVYSLLPLSETEVLVAGEKGETRLLRRIGNHGCFWRYGEEIDGFVGSVYSLQKLSDTEAIAFGSRDVFNDDGSYDRKVAETRILRRDDSGKWRYGDEIPGFTRAIRASWKLSERELLVMGQSGETRLFTIEDSVDALKRNLGKIIEKKKAE